MANQDIYKLVEELNKRKNISNDNKINDIYNLLDEVKKENGKTKDELHFEDEKQEKTLSDLKESTKPIIKPNFPTSIRQYDKRSECFINIIQAVEYCDNNPDYKKGHEDALSKYYVLVNNNAKDLYVVEGKVNDELNLCQSGGSDSYSIGYVDGLKYVSQALEKSKTLIAQKISEKLLKDLS